MKSPYVTSGVDPFSGEPYTQSFVDAALRIADEDDAPDVIWTDEVTVRRMWKESGLSDADSDARMQRIDAGVDPTIKWVSYGDGEVLEVVRASTSTEKT